MSPVQMFDVQRRDARAGFTLAAVVVFGVWWCAEGAWGWLACGLGVLSAVYWLSEWRYLQRRKVLVRRLRKEEPI